MGAMPRPKPQCHKPASMEKGLLVATYPQKVWATERVKCGACRGCLRVLGADRCIYGGPFIYVKREKEE